MNIEIQMIILIKYSMAPSTNQTKKNNCYKTIWEQNIKVKQNESNFKSKNTFNKIVIATKVLRILWTRSLRIRTEQVSPTFKTVGIVI